MRGGEFARNLTLYMKSQKYGFKEFMAYRTQAISWVLIQSLGAVSTLIMVSVIYSVSSGVPGWGYFQLLALGGLVQLTSGIMAFLISPRMLVRTMRNGGLDQLLLKPYNPLLMIVARNPGIRNLGGVVSGALLLAYALHGAGVGLEAMLVFIPSYLIGLVALAMGVIVLALVSYVLFKDASFTNWLMSIMFDASDYPATIYGIIGSTALSILLPVTFAVFFPAAAVFGYVSAYVVLGVALVCIAVAIMFYFSTVYLLRKYESGGG
ncbi:MAG: ABC-2 family transporter protein [Candidatus Marsarchaeota archaeon]|nr:ABC-2 family transporter protein [Candidatus Marsarchaeota archaeon]